MAHGLHTVTHGHRYVDKWMIPHLGLSEKNLKCLVEWTIAVSRGYVVRRVQAEESIQTLVL